MCTKTKIIPTHRRNASHDEMRARRISKRTKWTRKTSWYLRIHSLLLLPYRRAARGEGTLRAAGNPFGHRALLLLLLLHIASPAKKRGKKLLTTRIRKHRSRRGISSGTAPGPPTRFCWAPAGRKWVSPSATFLRIYSPRGDTNKAAETSALTPRVARRGVLLLLVASCCCCCCRVERETGTLINVAELQAPTPVQLSRNTLRRCGYALQTTSSSDLRRDAEFRSRCFLWNPFAQFCCGSYAGERAGTWTFSNAYVSALGARALLSPSCFFSREN